MLSVRARAEYQQQIAKFWRGDWQLGKGDHGKWFAQLYNNAKQALFFVYEDSMKQKDFVHRNWMRSDETLSNLQRFIKRSPGMTLKKE